MAGDLTFSDKQKIDQSELFPKAELYDTWPRRLVVHRNGSLPIEVKNPTANDVELLEQNGVIVSKR